MRRQHLLPRRCSSPVSGALVTGSAPVVFLGQHAAWGPAHQAQPVPTQARGRGVQGVQTLQAQLIEVNGACEAAGGEVRVGEHEVGRVHAAQRLDLHTRICQSGLGERTSVGGEWL